ncbi:TPA: site-specific DNA-methyltransferase [Legionella pneumophila]|nr:site-specific DNA-methyltransferase [Legionella sp. MW5194]HAT7873668.1 site-specific DNA-methyltransferase [Legionella pneumophila]HAT9162437.1 site-specific DNA-methyltransferase [Legionella pneumophila subsp. pneumophila]HAT7982891.1 site-specific DNA-methyltransferase [Legionella pneumophila]HAT7987420.1 site-specific DNA-methyltransferase [Legionella pneumophila]
MILMENIMYKLDNNDAYLWLKTIENESIDLVISDPPYESLEKHRAIGTTTRLKNSNSSSNEWFPVIKNKQLAMVIKEIYRILRPNSHFYLFCDNETMFYIKPIAEKVGFKFWKPIIWDKVNIGMGYHYRSKYENILFFEKGKRKLNNLSIPDILTCKRIINGYPTEKPVALNEILIHQSSSIGDIVADPFMGSGSVAEAALINGRKFIGTDIKSNAVYITEQRLKKATAAYG